MSSTSVWGPSSVEVPRNAFPSISEAASRCVAVMILLIGGYNMALPAYGWATAVQVGHGVFIDDVLVCFYLLMMVAAGTVGRLMKNSDAVRFAAPIALLGILGIVSAAASPYRFLDIGQALHLVLFSTFVLLAVHWSHRIGSTFVLRCYLAGVAVGGVSNIYFSIIAPKGLIGILPILRMQNGAGGVLGIAVSLGALLMIVRQTRADVVIAVVSSIVGVAASAISFSKTSMSICAFGIVAWLFVLGHSLVRRRSRMLGLMCLFLLAGAAAYAVRAIQSSILATSLLSTVERRFAGFDVKNKYSAGTRYMYFFGVGEVLMKNPVLGVSYGGFYDAITHTTTWATGEMADEDAEGGSRGESNPHNTFLYYASANGVPGLVIVGIVFLAFLQTMSGTVAGHGLPGRGIWACLALAYFIYANTLPTMLNTMVLYVPAAVGIAQATERRASGNRRLFGRRSASGLAGPIVLR